LDIYLPEHDIAFEYQGYQHYSPSSHSKLPPNEAFIQFENQRDRDLEKRILCKQHGIRLYEIPCGLSKSLIIRTLRAIIRNL
jgi:hypothetical protein